MRYDLITAIIFSLTIVLVMSPIEGHTVWFHNKMLPGTFGEAYITIDGAEVIGKGSWAHKGFHIDVDDAITDYNITFSVEATTKGDKLRGPFKNDRDYEWKFTGSIDIWNIHQLS